MTDLSCKLYSAQETEWQYDSRPEAVLICKSVLVCVRGPTDSGPIRRDRHNCGSILYPTGVVV